jgi:cephalosporin-C deacetylase-like acetyl esterase
VRCLSFLLVLACVTTGGLRPPLGKAADPPAPLPGEQLIRDYFQRWAKEIADDDLHDINTREDWESVRAERRRQLLDMLGLWPMPQKTDLHAKVTGKVERPKFTVEKVVFQSMPGLYVTGNLYVPKPAPTKAPTVLYVCGHGNVVKDGVSYGSKTFYQHHPAWYAEHGFVSLIIDTLQLSEIPGLHHGTYREKMWWWHTLGYTPAGVECWNAMRALDYLETRPEVDPKRIGVAGRSGGGAYSWWIAATDERVACAVPVAGIADLQAHLNEGYPGRLEKGVIAGHCDCMFMVNTYRWDFPSVAALVAPRPLLLGNSDKDDIFPVPGYRRLAEKTRKIYELYGAGSKFALLETQGKHEDTPELQRGEYRWMCKWLKGEDKEFAIEPFEKIPPQELKVLDKTPEDQINTTIQESFIKPADIELPKSADVIRSWWPGEKAKLETALRDNVFGGWQTRRPVALACKHGGSTTHHAVRLQALDFPGEAGVMLRLWVMTAGDDLPKQVILNVLDEAGWDEWCADLGPDFADILQRPKMPKWNEAKFKQNKAVMADQKLAFAAVCPRGVGPTKWAEPGSVDDTQIRRRFALIGQTLDGQRVLDVTKAVNIIGSADGLKGVPVVLQGKNEMAGIALYAALFSPKVDSLELWHLPPSHRQGPTFLNVRKYLDTPQALAMMVPRSVKLFVKDETEAKAFSWALDLQKALGKDSIQVRIVGE